MHDIATNILTPKRRVAEMDPHIQRELLFESQPLRLIIATYEQSAQQFDDMVEAAVEIGTLVRRTIDFASTTGLTPPLTPQSIADREATNCFGHAIVASECLERLGMEHFIGYANQHAFVMLADRKSDRSFMLDVATKELYQETTQAIGGDDIIQQLELGGLRAVNVLDSRVLIRQLPPMKSVSAFVDERPWLSYAPNGSGAGRWRESKPRDYLLQLITLPAAPGRQLLEQQLNALIALTRGDYVEAHHQLSDLDGLYLDVDNRNNLVAMNKLCRRLIQNNMSQHALQIAEVVDASLVPNDRSKNQLFLPDMMRRVARQLGDVALMQQAVARYQALPCSNLTEGKLKKALEQLRTMV